MTQDRRGRPPAELLRAATVTDDEDREFCTVTVVGTGHEYLQMSSSPVAARYGHQHRFVFDTTEWAEVRIVALSSDPEFLGNSGISLHARKLASAAPEFYVNLKAHVTDSDEDYAPDDPTTGTNDRAWRYADSIRNGPVISTQSNRASNPDPIISGWYRIDDDLRGPDTLFRLYSVLGMFRLVLVQFRKTTPTNPHRLTSHHRLPTWGPSRLYFKASPPDQGSGISSQFHFGEEWTAVDRYGSLGIADDAPLATTVTIPGGDIFGPVNTVHSVTHLGLYVGPAMAAQVLPGSNSWDEPWWGLSLDPEWYLISSLTSSDQGNSGNPADGYVALSHCLWIWNPITNRCRHFLWHPVSVAGGSSVASDSDSQQISTMSHGPPIVVQEGDRLVIELAASRATSQSHTIRDPVTLSLTGASIELPFSPVYL